jgi:hypothetical protein
MSADISTKQEIVEDGVDEPTHRFITNDYLFLLFRNKPLLHLRVFWAVTVITFLSGGVAFGLQGLVGIRFGMTGGYLSNTIAAFLETIIPPLFFLLYPFIPCCIVDLFKTLNANGVICACRRGHPDMTTYGDFQKRLETWVNSWWWTWGILFIGAIHRVFLPRTDYHHVDLYQLVVLSV